MAVQTLPMRFAGILRLSIVSFGIIRKGTHQPPQSVRTAPGWMSLALGCKFPFGKAVAREAKTSLHSLAFYTIKVTSPRPPNTSSEGGCDRRTLTQQKSGAYTQQAAKGERINLQPMGKSQESRGHSVTGTREKRKWNQRSVVVFLL